jgi:hypothetical protein
MGQDFGADVAAQVRPQADLFLTRLQRVLEVVDGHVHGVSLDGDVDVAQ